MSYFVLEIGTEEMPARFLPGLSAELYASFVAALTDAHLDFGQVKTFATPRRLVITVDGLAQVQREEEEVVTGPPYRIAFDKEGKPTQAAVGFAKGLSLPVEALFAQDTDKGQYLAARKKTGGARTLDLLPGMISRVVPGLSFPKKMRWGTIDFGFGRPLRWILALLDADLVELELAGLTSGRNTYGHRVMGPGPFAVDRAEEYVRVIEEQGKVVLSHVHRLETVRARGDELAAEVGGRVIWNDALLQQVANLVEYPRPVLARFDQGYLELPREVLLTSMETHQKSFGVEDAQGNLMPYFLTTINIEPTDIGLVRKGWERVLKARLEDARFFWRADTSKDFDQWLRKLESVVFIGPLGSMGDKSRRLEKLCGYLAQQLAPEMFLDMSQAGRLAKSDLVSEMVGEFAELQGLMGGIYARRKGESDNVAQAVYEQYLPAGPDSPVPSSLSGALLAMADKADTLAGCFGLNNIPTGAADPYALRRAALGIIRIVLERNLRLDLRAFLATAQTHYGDVAWKLQPAEALDKLLDFFGQRLKAYFSGKGYETLLVEAALGAGFADITGLSMRLAALDRFSKADDFQQAVLTFKRAANIIRKQGQEAGTTLTGAYDPALFAEDAERSLATAIENVAPRWDGLWDKDDYDSLLGLLRELRPSVDAFFDGVMVMTDDTSLRVNRLNLLQALVDRLSGLADFAALQV